MTLSLDGYEQVAESHDGDVVALHKTVETPLPNGETQKNTKRVWKTPDGFIALSKVSDNGWRIASYNEKGKRIGHKNGYIGEEEAALDAVLDYLEGKYSE